MRTLIALSLIASLHLFARGAVTPVKYKCSGKVIRKEVREMTDSELSAFITAFKKTAIDGTLLEFTDIHERLVHKIHHAPCFLPWHRVYLAKFEKELINRGAPFLPYWDWAMDIENDGAKDIYKSVVFSDKYFGMPDPANKHQLKDSAFSFDKYLIPKTHTPLVRDWDAKSEQVTVYSHKDINTVYMPMKGFSNFAKYFEGGPHYSMHMVIGGASGEMSDPPRSPQDPLFWLHHTFIDKLWHEWQEKNGASNLYDGQSFTVDQSASSSDLLLEYNIEIGSILSTDSVCVSYKPDELDKEDGANSTTATNTTSPGPKSPTPTATHTVKNLGSKDSTVNTWFTTVIATVHFVAMLQIISFFY